MATTKKTTKKAVKKTSAASKKTAAKSSASMKASKASKSTKSTATKKTAAKTVRRTTKPSLAIGPLLGESWTIVKREYLSLLAIYVLGIFVPMVVFGAIFGEKGSLITNILSMVISAGFIKAMLDVVQKKDIDVSFLWTDFTRVINYVLVSFLYAFAVIIGFILFIIPGIILGLKYRYAPYLVITKGLGPIEAMKASDAMTLGYKWDIFAIDLVSFGLGLIGAIALGIGLLVAVPVIAVAQILVFLKLQK